MRRGRALFRSPSRSALQWGLLLAPLLFFVVVAWTHRNLIEDGFIYLRVVHQVTDGHGPVFNVGERVEAFTGPLWLAILSFADLVTPVRLEWLAVLIGMAATFGGVVLAMAGSARLSRLYESEALLVPFGVIVLVSLAAMWFYASSGLETGITFLWLGSCLWLLANWAGSTKQLRRWSAVVLGLGWLVRPELVMYSIAFLTLVLAVQWRTDTWRYRIRFLVAAVALPVAYQIFRMGYYGALVANTAIAKEGTRLRWERGWRYLVDFAGSYWLVIAVLVLLVGGWIPLTSALAGGGHRRGAWVVGVFVGAGLLNAAYVVAVGGDYEHARLLLPSLFAVCAPIAVVPAVRRYLVAGALAPWALAAVAVMRPPELDLGSTYALPQAGSVTTDDAGWGPNSARLRRVSGPGLILSTGANTFEKSDVPLAPTAHNPTGALTAVGLMPYAAGTNFYVLDLLGLADPLTARFESRLWTTLLPYAGHEKELPRPWIAARLLPPDARVRPADLPGAGLYALIPAVGGEAFDQQIKWARAAWDCPEIRRLRQSSTSKLTVGRFFRNIVDSFANTRMRIPPDPETAYRKFCGDASPATVGLSHPGLTSTGVVATAASRPVTITNERGSRAEIARDEGAAALTPRHIVSVAGFV